MKRLWFSAGCILCAVLLVGLPLPNFLPVIAVCGLIGAGVGLILLLLDKRFLWRDVLFYGVCLALACAFAAPVASAREKAVKTYDGAIVRATVELCDDGVMTSGGDYRYTARPETPLFSQKFLLYSSVPLPGAGSKVTGDFKFSAFHGDDAWEDLSRGAVLSGELLSKEKDLSVTDAPFGFSVLSARLRGRVRNVFYRYLQGDEAGLMVSLFTGDKQSLSDASYDSLRQTGMLHIVAVSGLHVSIFIAFVLLLLRRVRNPRLKWILSLLSLGVILLLAGFTPSVTRAVLMSAFAFLERRGGYVSLPLNRLGLAALIILLVDPYAAFSLSFQLSFTATCGILVLAKPLQQALVQWLFLRRNVVCGRLLYSLVSGFAASAAAFSFTLPVLWLRTGTFSVWSLVLTPLLMPLLELCIFAGLFLLLTSLIPVLDPVSRALGLAASAGLKIVSYLLRRAAALMGEAELSPALVRILAVTLVALMLFSLWTLWGKRKQKRGSAQRRRRFAVVCVGLVLVLFVYQFSAVLSRRFFSSVAPEAGYLQTVSLPVGDGYCTVTVFEGHAAVIDCGGTEPAGSLAADYLSECGIDTVDYVILTDLSERCTNGLQALLQRKKAAQILCPQNRSGSLETVRRVARSANVPVTMITRDASVKMAGVRFHLLVMNVLEDHDLLAVLTEYGYYRELYCGYLDTRNEDALAVRYGDKLDCDVLVVGSNGAENSCSSRFLGALSPRYAVISCGNTERYGKPASETLTRLRAVSAGILRTDSGSRCLRRSDGKGLEVVEE